MYVYPWIELTVVVSLCLMVVATKKKCNLLFSLDVRSVLWAMRMLLSGRHSNYRLVHHGS
jgi:hypothetical protein